MLARICRLLGALVYVSLAILWLLILAFAALIVAAVLERVWAPLGWIVALAAVFVLGLRAVNVLASAVLLFVVAWQGED